MSGSRRAWRQRLAGAAIALAVAAPMLVMAVRHRIDYDDWWHVFIARVAPWAQFWRDVRDNAHPPLFYLLLRVMTQLGRERLVYRALSIAAALAAVYVVGRVAARLYRTPAVALLCALAFGLALPTVVMACAVRGYMLSVLLTLAALRLALELIDPTRPDARPGRAGWLTVALVAAILTHYAAALFAVAVAALPFALAGMDRTYRAWLGRCLRTEWRAIAAVAAPVAVVVAVVYAAHVSRFDEPMSHTAPFYPSPEEWAAGPLLGAAAFVARGLVAEVDLFVPIALAAWPGAAQALLLGALGGLAVALLALLRPRADRPVAAAPLVLLALLGALMIAAALLGRYPFGGFLRHQYLLFPFLVLSAFALVDELAVRVGRPRLVVVIAGALVLLGGGLQWRRVALVDDEMFAAEVGQFDALLPDSAAVYVDRFSLIPFIASRQRDGWSPQRAVGEDVVAVPVRRGDHTQLVLRDTRRWSCDLTDPALYRDLRALIDRQGLAALDVFRLRQDAYRLPPASRAERLQLAESVPRLASRAGLRVERLVLDGLHVYARLLPSS